MDTTYTHCIYASYYYRTVLFSIRKSIPQYIGIPMNVLREAEKKRIFKLNKRLNGSKCQCSNCSPDTTSK